MITTAIWRNSFVYYSKMRSLLTYWAVFIDVVLSHTCPFKYEPVEEFLPGIDQSTVDDSTEKWLDVIEETTDYMAWFCGHWHTNKRIDKMHFLFHQFESSEELQKMKVNKTNLEREMEDG